MGLIQRSFGHNTQYNNIHLFYNWGKTNFNHHSYVCSLQATDVWAAVPGEQEESHIQIYFKYELTSSKLFYFF